MARTLLPSLLDRLLDDEPGVDDEVEPHPAEALRQIHAAVARDLSNLLNCRARPAAYPTDLKWLKQSLVNYGLPDFTGSQLGSAPSQEAFIRTIETVLKRFEPRLTSVRVTRLSNKEPLDRTLRFRIDAILKVGTTEEAVSFDSRLEPATGAVEVGAAE